MSCKRLTSGRRVVCTTLIGFFVLSGGSAGAQTDPTENQFLAAYRAKDYAKAVELGLKLTAAQPASTVFAYNLGCVYALRGDRAEALTWISKAVDLGFDDVELFETDPDIASLRGEEAYRRAVEKVRKRSDEFAQKARRSEPLIIAAKSVDAGKPAPAIVALHPFGGSAETFAEQWRDVAEQLGAVLILPRGVRSAGSGFRWGQAAETDDIVVRALETAREQHKLDPQRVVLTGFSQGAQMTFILALRHPLTFAGAIPVCGLYNPADAPMPLVATTSLPKFVILVGAEDDPQVVESNRLAAQTLKQSAVKVELRVYPGVGHAFPKDRSAELLSAVKFILGDMPQGSPGDAP